MVSMGNRTISAVLSGTHAGSSVDFTKTYPGGEWGYENPVDYVGQLSSDGLSITGMWSLLDMNGAFEMHRDAAEEIKLSRTEGAEADLAKTSVR